jgi:AbrB family looped-hinge helix DNA binding protein
MAEHDVARREVTLSSKHQIVVPRESRRALGLKPGDKLLVVTLADQVIVLRKPAGYVEATRGLMRGVYPKDYLRRERRTWE